MDPINLLYSLVENDRNLEQVRELLLERVDPNEIKNDFGYNALHYACLSSQRNIEIIRELIKAGADLNRGSEIGFTPLHCAVMNRRHDIIELLLQAGANVNAETTIGMNLLHFAINSDLNDFYLPDLLHVKPTCRIPDTPTIRRLLQMNINVNADNCYGETPLMWAVDFRHFPIVNVLLENGADPNICDYSEASPLHMALNNPRPSYHIVYFLLLHGADLCKRDDANESPIDIIIRKSRDEEYFMFAKFFVKMATFHNNFNERALRNLERHPELENFQLVCKAEVNEMRNDVISRNLTVHQFLLRCPNEEQFIDEYNDVCVELYKSLVFMLMTGKYLAYLHDILIRIDKFILSMVLKYDMPQTEPQQSPNVQIAKLLRMTRNCDLSRYMSHWEIFKIMLSISNLSDAEINAITTFEI